MNKEQVSEGDLVIDSMRDFKCSISTRSDALHERFLNNSDDNDGNGRSSNNSNNRFGALAKAPKKCPKV